MRSLYIIPLGIFLILVCFLWLGLSLDPKIQPQAKTIARLNQTLPAFRLTSLNQPEKEMTEQIFKNKIVVLNVWASWCSSCRAEHATLLSIVENKQVNLIGLNFHDTLEEAKEFLKTYGNPYQEILFDKEGRLAVKLGVRGTPETYVIDKQGKVQYRHSGPLTEIVWQEEILPIVRKLNENE
jgi:cytochrome c biogenesis protein CcmG/thiol:disulfide interchange protein DsbE